MRSYEAARTSFNVFEFMAVVLIIIGIAATIPAMMAAESRGPLALLGALPGVAIAAIGFFAKAYVQTARATVDSAEYAQQSLQLARDQYEISKQMLQYASAAPAAAAYTADGASTELKDVSFDTDKPASETPTAAEATEPKTGNQIHQYAGSQIEERDGAFLIGDRSYPSLIDAKLAIDGDRHRAELTNA